MSSMVFWGLGGFDKRGVKFVDPLSLFLSLTANVPRITVSSEMAVLTLWTWMFLLSWASGAAAQLNVCKFLSF